MNQTESVKIRVTSIAKKEYFELSKKRNLPLAILIKKLLDIELKKEKGNGTDSTDIEVLK